MSGGVSSRDGASEEVARTLAAFVRAEFQAPVARLRGLIDILAEDVIAAGLEAYAGDVERMRNAGARLDGLVTSLLDGSGDDASPASATLRHDLRTPVTAIVGYGELIAEEARDDGRTDIFPPLADVLESAGRLLKELDKLVAFSGSASRAGEIAAESGTIPDVLRHAATIARSLSRHSSPALPAVTGRILVVDDNASMRDLVARRLTREGHDVTLCGSGEAGLRRAREGGFDLMLLDLMMPGLNGLDVMERLRSEETTRALPVIVISALDEVDTAVRCIEAGADDLLSKPLNETLLRARIASSLERKFLRDREREALSLLKDERERSEQLLRNILPESVVARLHGGETVIADHLDDVTVLFCDLVGFTALSARLDPAETLDLLNGIFSGFDHLAEENGLEKIKTIGDAYMVVGGMSEPRADHALRVVRMAAGMPAVAAAGGRGLDVRIGIDRGPAVAGIIGRRKFFYDVWGDTVNTASRLETTAENGRVHMSEAVKAAVNGAVTCEPRPPLAIKGKGLMQTYYLAGHAG